MISGVIAGYRGGGAQLAHAASCSLRSHLSRCAQHASRGQPTHYVATVGYDISPLMATLSPAECAAVELADPPRAMCGANYDAFPPDRHVLGSRLSPHHVVDMMRLLRNKQLAFSGDSVTEQYSRALACAVRAKFPGDVKSLRLRLRGAVGLRLSEACRSLLEKAMPPATCADVCNRPSDPATAFPTFGPCHTAFELFAGLKGAKREPASLRARLSRTAIVEGLRVVSLNATVLFRFGSISMHRQSCPVCGSVRGSCRRYDACSLQHANRSEVPPSNVELLEALGVDGECTRSPSFRSFLGTFDSLLLSPLLIF